MALSRFFFTELKMLISLSVSHSLRCYDNRSQIKVLTYSNMIIPVFKVIWYVIHDNIILWHCGCSHLRQITSTGRLIHHNISSLFLHWTTISHIARVTQWMRNYAKQAEDKRLPTYIPPSGQSTAQWTEVLSQTASAMY